MISKIFIVAMLFVPLVVRLIEELQPRCPIEPSKSWPDPPEGF